MTKIDIISGFLGAGKTTLIKKLIDGAFTGEKLVLIENEFGEIGIDGGFLKDAGVQITEMNQGCICCSLVGDFGKALKEVIDTYSPDRIIIEPSGVGKLSDVIKAVLDLGHIDGVVLNSSTTVVDCTKAKMYMKNFGEFFNNQIESAGAVILSRTQIAKEGQVEDCVARIREKNADAAIVTTPWDDIDAAAIVGAMEHTSSVNEMIAQAIKEHEEHEYHHHEHGEDCTCGCHDHDHEHEHHHDHDHEEHEHHHDHDHEEHEHHHDHDHEEHEHHHDHEHEEHEHHHDHDHHHEHGEDCTCGCHDHDHEHGHHHADDVFTSWGKETAKTFEKDKLDTILDTLANTEKYGVILRAKGIVQSASGKWFNFDLTPGEYEIREGVADYTGKLCVIGTKLDEDGLVELFEL